MSRVEKIKNRLARTMAGWFNRGLYDPGFTWRDDDALTLDPKRRHIVVQTHLEGLPSKRWAVDHWMTVLRMLRDYDKEATVHILDPAGAVFADTGICVQDKLTFPQAVRLVESCSFLLSVDSWSKYVAGWKNIPQVVVVPDQTSDYPQLTASAVWKHSFRGLHKLPKESFIGLKSAGRNSAIYTAGTMSEIDPRQVAASCLKVLKKHTTAP